MDCRASTWRSVLSLSTRRATSKCATSDEDAICVACAGIDGACRHCRDEVGSAGGPQHLRKVDVWPPTTLRTRAPGRPARPYTSSSMVPLASLQVQLAKAPVDTGRVPEATWKQRSASCAAARGARPWRKRKGELSRHVRPGSHASRASGEGSSTSTTALTTVVVAVTYACNLRLLGAHERDRGERRPGRLS